MKNNNARRCKTICINRKKIDVVPDDPKITKEGKFDNQNSLDNSTFSLIKCTERDLIFSHE